MPRLPGTYQLVVEHPAKFFRNSTMRFAAQEDWKKAARIQREGVTLVPPPIERWQWAPTFEQAVEYLMLMYGIEGAPQPVWAIDFEATVDGAPVCMGIWDALAPLTHQGLCVPFLCQGGAQYWTKHEAEEIHRLIVDILTADTLLKTGQNLVGYDTGFPPLNKRSLVKRAWDVDVAGIEIDTFPLHHICFAEVKHGLDTQASLVTDLSRYKQELHEHDDDEDEDDDDADDWSRVLEKPDEELRTYCLKDTFSQAMARLSLLHEAEVLG